MTRSRIRRLLSIVVVAALGVAMLGVAPVSAATPNWDITFEKLPTTVKPGNDAGVKITVHNYGPSNINDLTLVVTPVDYPTATWTYLSPLVYDPAGSGSGSCDATTPLTCNLGTLAAYTSVSLTVAYTVPADITGKTFDITAAIRAGTGDTGADTKGKSRGDAFNRTVKIALNSSPNFDGGFVVGDDSFQTSLNLGPRNIQATGLTGADEFVGVMVEDGITSGISCDEVVDPGCTSELIGLFAEWSRVHVANGATFGTPFKVTMTIRGSDVPGGATEDTIYVAHVLDTGAVDIIGDDPSETCTFAGNPYPSNPDCLTVTKNGNVWIIEVWLLQNGALRGGF